VTVRCCPGLFAPGNEVGGVVVDAHFTQGWLAALFSNQLVSLAKLVLVGGIGARFDPRAAKR